ncbi:unnamed protein product [Anisakis simplex]|uniref:Uncharacterized protein n=1 Tax=Anisakis simplex TaxID=6269 RepID=A0A0M3KF86_ANISI|nr:unnamed protein product [Anisakis simplex]
MIEASESLTEIFDEQVSEANEPEATQKQYRFNWSLLGEAELFLANEQSLYCAFSRAILKDYQLMKASERRPPPLAAGKDAEKDSLCKLFEQKINFGHQHMKTSKPKLTANNIDIKQGDESSSAYYQPNAYSAERKSSISDLPAFDTEDQSAVTELQQDEMASMGLPMEFSKPPSAEKKKKGKRKRKKPATECVNNSDNWMIGLDFENYWSLTGEYVTNMTWLNDFGLFYQSFLLLLMQIFIILLFIT